MVVLLVLSMGTTLVSAGYQLQRLDSVDKRLTELEEHGSVTAQITTKDIEWLREAIDENNIAHKEIVIELRSLRQYILENSSD